MTRYSIVGMRDLEDCANQINLLKGCVEESPSNSHLEMPDGNPEHQYILYDLFSIQKVVRGIRG